MPHGGERGAVLLEAMVALVIVTLSATAAIHVIQVSLADLRGGIARENRVRQASRVLARYGLLRQQELDQRVGTQQVGEFAVTVRRPEARAWRIGIADTASPRHELLVTIVTRRETP